MNTPFAIILNHFFADFFLQTEKMAINKSSSNRWLSIHILAYTLGMIPFTLYMGYTYGALVAIGWLIVNGLLHFVTDFFTSRLTGFLYKKSEANKKETFLTESWMHWYYVAIGFDQVIHYGCLSYTYDFFKAL